MTGPEAARVDALEEASAAAPDAHARCDLWSSASKDIPKSQHGALRYVAERRKNECRSDPADAFRGTIEEREQTIAKATEGYFARGANFELRGGEPIKLTVKRGECYRVALRFPEGFVPATQVSVSFKRWLAATGSETEISGGKAGPGPAFVAGLACAFTDQDGTLRLDAGKSVVANATLYVQAIPEAEVVRLEAEDSAQWKRAEASANAFRAEQAVGHCQRCADDRQACGTNPDCQSAYVDCLHEDRGDEVLEPEQCP